MSDYSTLDALSVGLLLARLVFGLAMAAHGTQKLFGWFGGYGLAGTGGFFEGLGFRPGERFALAAGLAEFAGGVLIALGLLGPIGPALVVSVMLVAAVTVHLKNPFFASTNGIEVTLLYAAAAAALALTGPGIFSLDALLGLQSLWTSQVGLIALAAGILGSVANLVLLRKKPLAA
jgi:putative oxidoreductase